MGVIPPKSEATGPPSSAPAAGLSWGSLRLPSRFTLAPLAGYTTLAFRQVVRELGGLGLATTDLVNARALLLRSRRTLELIQTCPSDRPVAVQIYGTVPEEMREAAQWLEGYGISSVDINMGCPVHKVVRGGGGSAMLCDADRTIALVRTIVEAVRIPVSVKMRLGWDDDSWSAPFFARRFEEAGVAGLTIHGRTRAQGFGGAVNLDGIKAVVEAVERIPVLGNGDVKTLADAERMLRHTGCAGIAVGRGALLNPWIFAQLHRWTAGQAPAPRPGHEERLALMNRHFRLLVEHRGETFGCLTFRKVANWYCRGLKPSHDVQQGLVRVSTVAEFEHLVDVIRAQSARRATPWQEPKPVIPVPRGPVEHW